MNDRKSQKGPNYPRPPSYASNPTPPRRPHSQPPRSPPRASLSSAQIPFYHGKKVQQPCNPCISRNSLCIFSAAAPCDPCRLLKYSAAICQSEQIPERIGWSFQGPKGNGGTGDGSGNEGGSGSGKRLTTFTTQATQTAPVKYSRFAQSYGQSRKFGSPQFGVLFRNEAGTAAYWQVTPNVGIIYPIEKIAPDVRARFEHEGVDE
ncbi:hypothetical protein BDZ45DRAFT_692309 [Acephala macrosclerotiorum]|nr:hypothetical protein BDZ45DRAFT_692309 [Acephala macrosclerotiorum]